MPTQAGAWYLVTSHLRSEPTPGLRARILPRLVMLAPPRRLKTPVAVSQNLGIRSPSMNGPPRFYQMVSLLASQYANRRVVGPGDTSKRLALAHGRAR